MSNQQQLTIVSAPGKVLIVGGYLVLDRSFNAVVISTDSRFYCMIKDGQCPNKVVVKSPQFEEAVWEYDVEDLESFNQKNQNNRNTFVRIAIKYTLGIISQRIESSAFAEIISRGLEITILGSNDFYSLREQLVNSHLPLITASMRLIDPLSSFHAPISKVHKTGLGSSAALVTSIVTALYVRFGVVHQNEHDEDYSRHLVNNTAQICHGLAQGKIGSGFDVSAAVWGSHVYKRFSTSVVEEAFAVNNEDHSEGIVNFKTLSQIVEPDFNKWDSVVRPTRLPPQFILMLADVDAGSHTPSMVGKVLAWRKTNPEKATKLWNELGACNQKIEDGLRYLEDMSEVESELYEEGIRRCSELPGEKWSELSNSSPHNSVIRFMDHIYQTFQQIRNLLRQMSTESEVPIEPPEQTELLDACMKVAGVVMAGVPGAGGYDAIFCVCISEDAVAEVEKVCESWRAMNVLPLLSRELATGYLIEKLEDVKGIDKYI
ncbi:504_t:CDS:2 [Paraglomus brasilianum]|uniref:Phosphomevalonate kinase n=1 Tax=Paraglomus brasilianum TaxID=144538 RepID=A0A9N9D4E0_9GLOM|nr:504_t:CDS:2 [Paraglomus brasilianum]